MNSSGQNFKVHCTAQIYKKMFKKNLCLINLKGMTGDKQNFN